MRCLGDALSLFSYGRQANGKNVGRMAREVLSEVQFWAIIENSDKGKNLERELLKLSEAELFTFRFFWWDYFHEKSYNQALWAVAYTVLGYCSDDAFDYFRFWLVSRGKKCSQPPCKTLTASQTSLIN